ncbi:MAG: hypothetical protein JWO86_1592 [Myxococcaceae bacterium]|nr:hypothetical protein [Myxococcaceae bacterium]
MKLSLARHIGLLATLGVLGACAAACGDDPNALSGRGNAPGAGDGTANGANPNDPNAAPGALECTVKPDGRSYVLFDGSKLEATRINENVGVNRARLKPFAVMQGEYQRVLGLVPASLAASGGSFDVAPERWFAEAQHSGVSLNAIFDISFDGCLQYTKTAADYAAAPTTETATTVCTTLMRKAWSKTPAPEEIAACTTLATTKLASEPDVRRRWTYVCASVLSSSQFLTF